MSGVAGNYICFYVYKVLYIYVTFTFIMNVHAGNTSSGSPLAGPGDIEKQHTHLSRAAESGMIYLPLITLNIEISLIKIPEL